MIARHAASFTTEGAAKSGKPCDRFTPRYCWLSRVISRMTDSVNCVAFCDPVSFDMPCVRRRQRFVVVGFLGAGFFALLRAGDAAFFGAADTVGTEGCRLVSTPSTVVADP